MTRWTVQIERDGMGEIVATVEAPTHRAAILAVYPDADGVPYMLDVNRDGSRWESEPNATGEQLVVEMA